MNFFLPKSELTVVLKYSVHYSIAGNVEKMIEQSFPNYKLYVLKCVYIEDYFVPVERNNNLCQVALSLASDFKPFNGNVTVIRACHTNANLRYFFEVGKIIERSETSVDKVLIMCGKKDIHDIAGCFSCSETIRNICIDENARGENEEHEADISNVLLLEGKAERFVTPKTQTDVCIGHRS
jgi:hypothetical protein